MKWFYAEAGRQMGPIEESALDDLVRAGVVRDETLVWSEGMASWLPHGAVRGARPYISPMPEVPSAAAAATAIPGADATSGARGMPGASADYSPTYCVECGRPFSPSEMVMIGGAPVCAMCKPIYLQRLRESGQPIGKRRYAGFWIRLVARFIDSALLVVSALVVAIPVWLVFGLGQVRSRPVLGSFPMFGGVSAVLFFLYYPMWLVYEIYFVYRLGATLGKSALNLKIVRADGSRVSTGLAAGRALAYLIEGLVWPIGLISAIMAGVDPEKRSLHDRICETRVIYAR